MDNENEQQQEATMRTLDDVAEKVAQADSAQATQEPETPAQGAAPEEQSKKEGEQDTPAEGDTSASQNGQVAVKEPMIPKSRFDEVNRQFQQLKPIADKLEGIARRFGRNSVEYLSELERFYANQTNQTPAQVQDQQAKAGASTLEQRVQRFEQWIAQQEEQQQIQEHVRALRDEMGKVQNDPKYVALKGNWEKWQKVILGQLQAEPNRTADSVAQEIVELLNAERSSYIKQKVSDSQRRFEGGGGSTTAVKKPEKITRLKDFDKVIERAEKAQLAEG